MFGPLALVTVRQQQHQAAVALPLRSAAHQKLIDNDLRTIREVPELGFPQHQCVGNFQGITIFKAEHGGFGEQAINDGKGGLSVVDVGQRGIAILCFVVIPDGVALTERATPTILAAQPHRLAFQKQRTKRQAFGQRPVGRLAHPSGRRRVFPACGQSWDEL